MKYHILHDIRTSAPFKEGSFDHFEDVHQLKFLAYLGINLMLTPGRVIN